MTTIDIPGHHPVAEFPCFALNESMSSLVSQWGTDCCIPIVPHAQESTFLTYINNCQPPAIVVGADKSLLEQKVIAQASATERRPIIIALVESNNEALLAECYQQGADRVVVTPFCTARIFRALLRTLLTRHHYYPPYLINASIQSLKFGDCQVRLGKKRFDLAHYLFMNYGKLIPKSRILQDIWGLDSERCETRRVEVNMSMLRKELALDGTLGWEIRSSYNFGYGLFQTSKG